MAGVPTGYARVCLARPSTGRNQLHISQRLEQQVADTRRLRDYG